MKSYIADFVKKEVKEQKTTNHKMAIMCKLPYQTFRNVTLGKPFSAKTFFSLWKFFKLDQKPSAEQRKFLLCYLRLHLQQVELSDLVNLLGE